MNPRNCFLFAFVILIAAMSFPSGAKGDRSASKGGGSRGAKGGPVYVRGYTRKDGTYVRGYVRSSPGASGSSSPGGSSASSLHETDLDSDAPATTLNETHFDPSPTVAQPRQKPSPQPIPRAPVRPTMNVPLVIVLGDASTKRYYRTDCTVPATATRMQRSAAITKGYRPAPDCYSSKP
jgi:hypothetical protein